jgi:hypothetical protein
MRRGWNSKPDPEWRQSSGPRQFLHDKGKSGTANEDRLHMLAFDPSDRYGGYAILVSQFQVRCTVVIRML